MNKKFLCLLISVLLVQPLAAQNYIPLAVEGAHWVVRFDEMESIEPVDGLWEYYATGDTSINNIEYKKVYRRDLVITQDGPPFTAQGPYQLYGLVRDDTMNRKVYALKYNDFEDCPENEEYLLFDFSASIDDTLNLCIIPEWNEFIVSDIFNMEVLGFNTRVYADWDEIYEGMGSYYGLFEQMFAPFKQKPALYVQHTFLYYYCRENPCWLFVGTSSKDEHGLMKLYPNPAIDFIIVSTSEKLNAIKIFNQLGVEVTHLNGNIRYINVTSLNSGIYIAQIETARKTFYKKVYIH